MKKVVALSLLGVVMLCALGAYVTRPQLVVTGVQVPGGVEQGETVQAVVSVSNKGHWRASHEIVLLVEGDEVGRTLVEVAGGDSENIPFPIEVRWEPGRYRVWVAETDVANQLWVMTPAEFEVREVTVEPKLFHVGEDGQVNVTVKVANTGEARGVYPLRVQLNGNVREETELDVNGTSEVAHEFSINLGSPGSHVLVAEGKEASVVVHRPARPAHGTLAVNKLAGGSNRLKIVNNFDEDVLVVLANPGEGKPALLAVYVWAASSHTVRGIKNGTYSCYYSFGSGWCPGCKCFRQNASHGRFEGSEKMQSTRAMYSELTLIFGAEGSGVPTEHVPEEKFPKF